MSSGEQAFKADFQEARRSRRFLGRRSSSGSASLETAENSPSASARAGLLSGAALSGALLLPVVIVILLLAEAGSF